MTMTSDEFQLLQEVKSLVSEGDPALLETRLCHFLDSKLKNEVQQDVIQLVARVGDQLIMHPLTCREADEVHYALKKEAGRLKADWAIALSRNTGEVLHEVGVPNRRAQTFIGIAKKSFDKDGHPTVAVWTDGISVERAGVSSDLEPLAHIRLKEGAQYKVSVERIT